MQRLDLLPACAVTSRWAAEALEDIRVPTAFIEGECNPDEGLCEVASFGEALLDAVNGRRNASPP